MIYGYKVEFSGCGEQEIKQIEGEDTGEYRYNDTILKYIDKFDHDFKKFVEFHFGQTKLIFKFYKKNAKKNDWQPDHKFSMKFHEIKDIGCNFGIGYPFTE